MLRLDGETTKKNYLGNNLIRIEISLFARVSFNSLYFNQYRVEIEVGFGLE